MKLPGFDANRPLAEQLTELKRTIQKDASNGALRVYLFQLLAVQGDWQKALDQLQLCAQLDAKATPMAQTYREAIRGELWREKVFAGTISPHILGQPPEWLGWLIQATKSLANGHAEQAAELRAKAFDEAPALTGEINDTPFEWLADSDSRLGPVCELYANSAYYWVPFQAIRQISFEKPKDLRDMVWTACEVTLTNGGNLLGFIPTRYPAMPAGVADDLRLSRRTEWTELDAEHVAGVGQRVWVTDMADFSLLDTRKIKFSEES